MPEDAHQKMYELGSCIEVEAQFPVGIDDTGSIDEKIYSQME